MLDTLIYIPTILAYTFIILLIVILCFIVVYISHNIYTAIYESLPTRSVEAIPSYGADDNDYIARRKSHRSTPWLAETVTFKRKTALRIIITLEPCYLAYVVFEVGPITHATKELLEQHRKQIFINQSRYEHASLQYYQKYIYPIATNETQVNRTYNKPDGIACLSQDSINTNSRCTKQIPERVLVSNYQKSKDDLINNGISGNKENSNTVIAMTTASPLTRSVAAATNQTAPSIQTTIDDVQREMLARRKSEKSRQSHRVYFMKLRKYYDALKMIPMGRVMHKCPESLSYHPGDDVDETDNESDVVVEENLNTQSDRSSVTEGSTVETAQETAIDRKKHEEHNTLVAAKPQKEAQNNSGEDLRK